MTRVFISYRRDDCAGHAGRLYDHLVERFGDDAVFMDIDAIEPGVDFGERIEKAIGLCSVLIALIGDDWLHITDSAGRRRLDNPADLVRLEIVGALRRSDLRVIPVLVEGATMPPTEALPDDLKPLARRNALELSDGRWRYDADRLIEVVERVASPAPGTAAFGVARGRVDPDRVGASPVAGAAARHRFPTGPLALGGGIAAVVVAVVVVLLAGGGGGGGDGRDGGGDEQGGGGGRGGGQRQQPLTADAPIPSVTRPLSLALRGNELAVLGGPGDLRIVNANSGEEKRPRVKNLGAGASDVAGGFGSLWVTKHRTRSLLRIDPRTRRRVAFAYEPPTPGMPVAVATGEGAVWIGTDEPSGPDYLIKVTQRGKVARMIPVAGKIYDVAVGQGAVWITASPAKVVRIPVRGGTSQPIDVGAQPHGLAVGNGAVWVANFGDKSITRINSRTRRISAPIGLDFAPERIAVGGGSVWVTAQLANKLIRIDPRRRNVSDMIETKREPYALGVRRGREVWLTLAGEDAIQRVRFTR